MCYTFGWTLEYVDALDVSEAYEIIDIIQNRDLAFAHERKKAQNNR